MTDPYHQAEDRPSRLNVDKELPLAIHVDADFQHEEPLKEHERDPYARLGKKAASSGVWSQLQKLFKRKPASSISDTSSCSSSATLAEGEKAHDKETAAFSLMGVDLKIPRSGVCE